jgi:hypothetical protein
VLSSPSAFERDSFFGHLRSLYAETVLQTQLDQLKKQGSYDAFDLKWRDVYNVRRLEGGKTRQDGIPPSLFWESDVGKWYVAVFLRVRVVLGRLEHVPDDLLRHGVSLVTQPINFPASTEI